jgi:mannose-1-phosphate guanylyltransferase
VALAAEAIERPADEAMIILPADAHIADEAGLRAALAVAGEVAATGVLVTLGVKPDRPETGYGYVIARPPARVVAGRDTFAVDRFVEKPTAERAREMIATGLASWNAGIFVWTRAAIRDRLSRHAPEINGPIAAVCASGATDELALVYPSLRATSIDYAVMERASVEGAVAVVPIDVGWSDLGSWAALRDAWQEAARATARRAWTADPGARDSGAEGTGNRRDLGSTNSLVLAGDRLVVTIGLDDVIVVDTPDALLICSAGHSQEVRAIAEEMARSSTSASTREIKP